MYIGDGKSDREDDSVMSSNRLSHVIMLISAPAQKTASFCGLYLSSLLSRTHNRVHRTEEEYTLSWNCYM